MSSGQWSQRREAETALTQHMGRRGFLRLTATLGSAAGLSALLAACGGSAAPSPSAAPSSAAPASASPATATASAKPAASAAASTAASTSASAGASVAASPAASGASAKPAATAGVKLPTYMPIQGGPAPDLPPSADGVVAPGFTSWPKQVFKSVPTPPGDGSEVSIFTNVGGQPPTALDQNPALQAINKDMNATIKFVITSFADIPVKFATTIAGNDLPDIVTTLTRSDIALLPDMFDAKAADLTPYLSGDAIKDYPNLAALPTRGWKMMVYNGKIYGVPQPLSQFFWWPWVHQELLDQANIAAPKTAADFKAMLTAFTKPQQNIWGTASQGGYNYSYDMNTGNGWYPSLFGAPNSWAVDAGGKFTSAFETDQYKQALAYTIDLFKAGVFHPDTPTYNVVSARQNAFEARKALFRFDGLDPAYWDTRGTPGANLTPPAKVNMVTPFAANGGAGQYYNGRAAFGIAFLKKAPEARIKMLLRILNYVAAPLGSQEYMNIHYGVQGVDYAFDDKGNPIQNQKGAADLGATSPNANNIFANITSPAPTLFSAADPSYAARVQGYEKILAPISVEDASLGLVSQTNATKGVPVLQKFGDAISDIVAGRRPMSDFDQVLKDWKSGGGDTIRSEYEKAYAASK